MSAAAAPAPARPRRSRRTPLPPELTEQVRLPDKDHARIPNPFFAALRRKFWTAFEKDIALILIERCYGGQSDGQGGWDRPKWVELPAKEIARDLGNMNDSGAEKVEGIEKCLNALEDRGLIESKIIGRVKYCRLCDENFDSAPDRVGRTVERKPPEPAEEANVREVRPSEPLILLAGEKSRPFVLGDYRGRFTSGFSFPISVLPSIDDEGELDIAIHPHKGEQEAKANKRTGVHLSARDYENNGHGESSIDETAAAQLEKAEFSLMRDFLNRWCGSELGQASDQIVQQVLDALSGAPTEQLAARLKKRVPQLEYLTWKLIVDLATDVGRAHTNGRSRQHSAPAVQRDTGTAVQRDTFGEFLEVCARADVSGSRVDLENARKLWVKLSLEEQLLAKRGIEERVSCGEFANPAFRPRPDTYLAKRMWERQLRPAKGSEQNSDEKIKRAMALARKLEGRG